MAIKRKRSLIADKRTTLVDALWFAYKSEISVITFYRNLLCQTNHISLQNNTDLNVSKLYFTYFNYYFFGN